ncbi:Misexpression suppressor of KSR 2 [Aphelenchoides bicaudatus]|nr:Misexpression suppressor of KSR 2 [Aphelenchoides bicaudatus]
MSSIELGEFPFTRGDFSAIPIEDYVDTSFGKVKVSIYGDRSKKDAIVTFHDLGMDGDNNFQNFFQFGTIQEIGKQFCIYNINAPGQHIDADPLGENYSFPSMDGLAQIVDTVVNHYDLKKFIGMGVGAGSNVLLRYALKHQNILTALILINADCGVASWLEWGYEKTNLYLLNSKGMNNFTVNYLMWHNFGKREDECDTEVIHQYRSYYANRPNPQNLSMYMEAFLNRTEIVLQEPANSKTATPEFTHLESAYLTTCLGYFTHLNVRKAVDSLTKGSDEGASCAIKTVENVTELSHDSSAF